MLSSARLMVARSVLDCMVKCARGIVVGRSTSRTMAMLCFKPAADAPCFAFHKTVSRGA